MKRPINLVYWVEDRPPLGVMLLSGLQHVVLVAIRLVLPVLVCREAGLSPEQVRDVVGFSMLLYGVATALQALPRGPLGAGFLCATGPSSIYLAPALLAARRGGAPLVFGMTLVAGVIEGLFARGLPALRPFFPSEISGLVVMMVGFSLGGLGMRSVLGMGAAQGPQAANVMVGAMTLATMVGLTVWGKGALRFLGPLIGMGLGYVAAAGAGLLTAADLKPLEGTPLIHFPGLGHVGWSFEGGMMAPFVVAAMASCLRSVGDITTCQKINDAEWTRPDMRSIGRGAVTNGLMTAAAGLLGTIGVNIATSNIGLSGATGVTSRRIAYATGGIFLILAFLPQGAALFAIVPQPVLGAVVLFSASVVFVNGLQIVTSRMLDARRTFVIGLSVMVGIAVDLYPVFFRGLPAMIQPLTGSSLLLGTITALLLNLVFRLGVRRTQMLTVDPGRIDPKQIEGFLEAQGAAWGARREVIDRASFNLVQSIETIVEGWEGQGPLEIAASFDEFNLDVRVSYVGAPLELPEQRPSNEEIMASEKGQRRLAGFMLRRYADRVHVSHKDGRSTILFHFDH